MINKNILCYITVTFLGELAMGQIARFFGCMTALQLLALHPKNRTLRPIQLPDLGLKWVWIFLKGISVDLYESMLFWFVKEFVKAILGLGFILAIVVFLRWISSDEWAADLLSLPEHPLTRIFRPLFVFCWLLTLYHSLHGGLLGQGLSLVNKWF